MDRSEHKSNQYLKCKSIAEKHGGKCMSKEYDSVHKKLTWKCRNGHVWDALPSTIFMGGWCAKCWVENQKNGIKKAHALAQKNNGKCLSNDYINARTKLLWECSLGHKWEADYNHVQQGTWCRLCSMKSVSAKQRLTIEEMKLIAKERGGECLSEDYLTARKKLKWRCAANHIWEAAPYSIKSGSWCKKCNVFIGEEILRQYFEIIFKSPFPKSYPNWLNGLELDGFNKELSIAFEHHGKQHFEYIEIFHKNESNYLSQKKRDNYKARLCKEYGVVLIEISDANIYSNQKQFLRKLFKIFKQKGIQISKELNVENIKLDYSKIYVPQDKLAEIRIIAEKRGGKCLSNYYVNVKSNLDFQCKNGHIWKASFERVKRGSWCPSCSGNKKKDLNQMNEIAHSKGGFCLSKEYKGMNRKLQWKCAESHIWDATPSSIKNNNRWCPICARKKMGQNKLTLDYVRLLAHKQGGEYLGNTYTDIKTKEKWKCGNGHIWSATTDYIKQGRWCPVCAVKKGR